MSYFPDGVPENEIVPETVNEMILRDRIHALRRIIWELQRSLPLYAPLKDPNEVPRPVQHLEHTLRLAARADCEGTPFGLRIEARTYGPTKLGVGVYISNGELHLLKAHQEAGLLHHVQRNTLHQLAKFLSEDKQPEDLKVGG